VTQAVRNVAGDLYRAERCGARKSLRAFHRTASQRKGNLPGCWQHLPLGESNCESNRWARLIAHREFERSPGRTLGFITGEAPEPEHGEDLALARPVDVAAEPLDHVAHDSLGL
jgi:hypothetical protein